VSGAIIVFAKQPRAGFVKTRMTPPLTAFEASSLYECMLEDVLAQTLAFARTFGLESWLSVYPPQACEEMARRAPSGFHVVPQRGRDLSKRMEWAAGSASAAGVSPILLRGSDSPALSQRTMREALEALREVDVVISPDRDGGYSLVGMRRFCAGLFAHPMSTSRVLDETLRHIASRALRSRLLPPSFDLDTVLDLRWLAELRTTGATLLCPRTLAYLDAQDLWRHLRKGEGDGFSFF